MGREIERKFLVTNVAVIGGRSGTVIRQGYLVVHGPATVRVRRAGDAGYLTIKSGLGGLRRSEFEYPIPAADAVELLGLAVTPLVEKTRYEIDALGHTWDVDVFAGENEGLVVAEVELDDEAEHVDLPDWIGREVSDDPRYLNVNLARKPFRSWSAPAAGPAERAAGAAEQ
jgi:adenylate cyclase